MEVLARPVPESTDEALMLALGEGDDSTLARLIERWEVPLKRYLYRLLLNAADAEDLAEETFVKIYRARERFAPGRKFAPWIYAVATNLANGRWRWRKVRRLVSLDQPSQGLSFELSDPSALPGSLAAEARERAAAVRGAIAALPLDLRTVVLLFHYEEQSQAQIADALGCTPKAVETRLYRAREKLRGALAAWLREKPA